ncbi:RING finger domain-containing protein [Endozoicomonas sp. 8E]|uniref:RING finger domain-containing protein n=1 Tax=Endozoicomonas sp. 8E TaxID=3035692 RepID=UPI0029393477|nr:RING finger domain-containing protein [Endozoicomonas sp. 8E]WOG27566.1 CHY zinc finger protein [Endozoicomonas sp. 8E]
MHSYRSFITFVLFLMTMWVVTLCYSSTIIDRHNPGGQKVRIEINDATDPQAVSQWQVSLLLPDSFNNQNSTLCFKAPVVSADSNSIAILMTNDQSNYCYQLLILTKKQIPDFQHLSQQASKNGTLIRLKSATADKPELTSVTTDQLLNGKPHTTPLTLLVYSDNTTGGELETGQTWNNTVTLTGGKLAGIADFPGGGNGGFFYSRPPWGGGGGRPSGLFEIDLVILKPVINWLMSIGKDSISFEEQPSPARLKMTRVNADGSSSEAAIPVGWLDFLNIEQLNDVDFWNTLLQHAATSCPASESLQWQLACFKRFLERSALKTNHGGGLMAANEEGQPSGSAPDSGPKGKSNGHQKEKKEEPENQENQSPEEGHDGSGNGNNRKDDDGEESEKKATTEDLQVLANQLVAIIESQDPGAVFKLRQILNELDMPKRLRVLETKSTNTADTVTPLEAILKLQRSFNEHSSRNLFIEQLIKATCNTKKNLSKFDILSSLRPAIPPDQAVPEAGDNNLLILNKIVLDIIHKANQSDHQPPVGQFEKCCFAEFFAQLFLIYSNPVELIRNLLGKISDLALRYDVMINPQSLTFPACFLYNFTQFHQHPSFPELKRLLNELMRQAQNSHLQQVPSIGPFISNSDTIANETIASSGDTSTIQRAGCNQRASGFSGSSSCLLAGRNPQLEASPNQPALAHQQNDASQERLQAGPSSADHQATGTQDRSDLAVLRTNQNYLTSPLIDGSILDELARHALKKRERKRRQLKQLERQMKARRQMVATKAMQSNGAERSASFQQSSTHHEEANPSNKQLRTPVQKKHMQLCIHNFRLCRVNFGCCEGYFPCHRCHNDSNKCDLTDRKAIDAKRLQCSLCNYEGDITEDSQTCPGCNELMSEYFCAQCKNFTCAEKKPFHCDKCGICRTNKDEAFHCDVCNFCMNKSSKDTHPCRPDSGHDECCICLEDVFSVGFILLPCTHKVHMDCAKAMIMNKVRTCPVCRYALSAQLIERILTRINRCRQ